MPVPMAAPPSEVPMALAMLSMISYLLNASPLALLNWRYSKTFCWSSSVVLTSLIFRERSSIPLWTKYCSTRTLVVVEAFSRLLRTSM